MTEVMDGKGLDSGGEWGWRRAAGGELAGVQESRSIPRFNLNGLEWTGHHLPSKSLPEKRTLSPDTPESHHHCCRTWGSSCHCLESPMWADVFLLKSLGFIFFVFFFFILKRFLTLIIIYLLL